MRKIRGRLGQWRAQVVVVFWCGGFSILLIDGKPQTRQNKEQAMVYDMFWSKASQRIYMEVVYIPNVVDE